MIISDEHRINIMLHDRLMISGEYGRVLGLMLDSELSIKYGLGM